MEPSSKPPVCRFVFKLAWRTLWCTQCAWLLLALLDVLDPLLAFMATICSLLGPFARAWTGAPRTGWEYFGLLAVVVGALATFWAVVFRYSDRPTEPRRQMIATATLLTTIAWQATGLANLASNIALRGWL